MSSDTGGGRDDESFRLTLGTWDGTAVTLCRYEEGWRLGIEHRDDEDDPWDECDGAWAHLTRFELALLAERLLARVAAGEPQEGDR